MLPGPLALGLPRLEQDLRVAPRGAVVEHLRPEQLGHARGLFALAAGAREPVVELVDLVEELDLLDLEPRLGQQLLPLIFGTRADVRPITTSRFATRAISATAFSRSAK